MKSKYKGVVETDLRVLHLNELHRPNRETLDMIGIGKHNRKVRGYKT